MDIQDRIAVQSLILLQGSVSGMLPSFVIHEHLCFFFTKFHTLTLNQFELGFICLLDKRDLQSKAQILTFP